MNVTRETQTARVTWTRGSSPVIAELRLVPTQKGYALAGQVSPNRRCSPLDCNKWSETITTTIGTYQHLLDLRSNSCKCFCSIYMPFPVSSSCELCDILPVRSNPTSVISNLARVLAKESSTPHTITPTIRWILDCLGQYDAQLGSPQREPVSE